MNYNFFSICIKNKRAANMDSLVVLEKNISNMSLCIGVVCDGVGSLEHGHLASQTATQKIKMWFEQLEDEADIENIGLKLREYILKLNSYIIYESRLKDIHSASTLSAVLVIEDKFYIVHTGDSRIYFINTDKIQQITHDDVNKQGKLEGYIGLKEKIMLHYYEGSAKSMAFLLCSDGLYKKINSKEIFDGISMKNRRKMRRCIKKMSKKAIKRGEKDNISIAIISKKEKKDESKINYGN